jgi:hypothetical protein
MPNEQGELSKKSAGELLVIATKSEDPGERMLLRFMAMKMGARGKPVKLAAGCRGLVAI